MRMIPKIERRVSLSRLTSDNVDEEEADADTVNDYRLIDWVEPKEIRLSLSSVLFLRGKMRATHMIAAVAAGRGVCRPRPQRNCRGSTGWKRNDEDIEAKIEKFFRFMFRKMSWKGERLALSFVDDVASRGQLNKVRFELFI